MLRTFMLNVFLAVLYTGLVGSAHPLDFAIGFAIGVFVIALGQRVAGPAEARGGYLHRIWELLKFSGYFMKILIEANLQVAWEVVTPGMNAAPRFLRYPVGELSDAEVTALANAITLTPGTLSIDLCEPRPGDPPGHVLLVHAMYARDRDAAVAELDELKRRMQEEVFDDA